MISYKTSSPSSSSQTLAIDESQVAAAYRHAAHVVRTRAKNFFFGLALTPEPKRSAVYSIYAWMRTGDDIVDNDVPSTTDPQTQFQAFADKTSAIIANPYTPTQAFPSAPPLSDPLWLALAATIQTYSISPHIFQDMLAGLRADLHGQHFSTLAELEHYCRCVASTAGLACIQIWGMTNPSTRQHAQALAQQLGIAFQLTNICRDVATDASIGRVYLPTDLLHAQNITPTDVLAHSHNPRQTPALRAPVLAVVSDLCARAELAYARAAELPTLVHPDGRSALRAMTAIYHQLLRTIAADPNLALSANAARVPTVTKVVLAAKATLADVFTR